jgi:hypothetical protein
LQEKTLFSEGIFLEVFWMIIAENLFERLDRFGEDAFVEWDLKPHFLNELAEGEFATELAELNVFLPRIIV